MTKTSIIAAAIAAVFAFTSISASAANYHIFGTSNKNCNIDKRGTQQTWVTPKKWVR